MILITGAHKALALAKAVEEGVNHMWTVSAFQQHQQSLFICDEDATLELRVKTVKYFKVHALLINHLDTFVLSALGIVSIRSFDQLQTSTRTGAGAGEGMAWDSKIRMHQI